MLDQQLQAAAKLGITTITQLRCLLSLCEAPKGGSTAKEISEVIGTYPERAHSAFRMLKSKGLVSIGSREVQHTAAAFHFTREIMVAEVTDAGRNALRSAEDGRGDA